MAGLSLVNVQDFARAMGHEPTRATPETVAAFLMDEYLRRRGGTFNYNPATNVLFELFRGSMTEEQAYLACLTTGNPKGRPFNADAIAQVSGYAAANPSTCYRIGYAAIAVGRVGDQTLYVAIKAPLVRVVHNAAHVVMPGFRMSHRPVERQIDLACSVALASFARDDFADADFEYLYAGPGLSGKREFRVIHGRDRKVFDRDEVDALLDVYVKGVALVTDAGVEVREPNLRGYQIIDPRQPGLF
ncbi:hypothetical protein [Salinarimonas soli]|uniref:Uncharacterized protein n=1 Tax=Salinarimonas soli TaxID=1638099 RepID=A0A5B2VDW1_9HYPH|nr:hypothetical protein [Salinarimonas soli]KAA2236965.1 hypothetical protein F0L46_11880 [Salinarimonas soli]